MTVPEVERSVVWPPEQPESDRLVGQTRQGLGL